MAENNELEPDPTVIGEISSPPFVKLPETATIFADRAKRLRAMADVSPLKPYLQFVADLTDAQNTILAEMSRSSQEALPATTGAEFGMPQIDRAKISEGDALNNVFDRLFVEAGKIEMPSNAADALARVAKASQGDRMQMVEQVFSAALPPETLAEHIFIWAGVQVLLTHKASLLDSTTVKPVADGVCPSCGGLPSSSIVVGWKGAHGARFCSCSLCNTLWHYVRVKCVCCGSTKGISYKEVEDGGGIIKAETCDECQSWVKIIYQQKSPESEQVADDVATLGIDMMMRDTEYRRGGFSPLLAGL